MASHASPEQIAKRLSPGQREALLWLPETAGDWKGPAPSGSARMLAAMARMADPLVVQGKRTPPTVVPFGSAELPADKGRHVPYAATALGAEVRRHVQRVEDEEAARRPEPQPWFRRVGGMRFFRFGRLQISVCMLKGERR